MDEVDAVVVGAGVVGLAAARALALQGREVILLEAADAIGTGTSSRNSEVIHAGIYYPTGSLKAASCIAGRRRLYDYCDSRGIPYRRCGKLIVAADDEELPKLVETCKQYMSYEQEVLEKVTTLRNEAETARRDGDVGTVTRKEGALGLAVGGLLARAEAYPDLKAAETFRQLLGRISALEESISDRREFYNEAVNINNIRREQFPDMLVAKPFGFGARPLFEAEPEATKNVDMKSLFGA